jgi:hypothetical protein
VRRRIVFAELLLIVHVVCDWQRLQRFSVVALFGMRAWQLCSFDGRIRVLQLRCRLHAATLGAVDLLTLRQRLVQRFFC